jgi:hypothetical protein
VAALLSDAQIDRLAQVASWKFDIDYKDYRTDPVVFTGDGVDDLDKLIVQLSGTFVIQPRVLCDVGSLFSDWRKANVDDVIALKAKYITYYGTVSKPETPWSIPNGSATEITQR